MISRADRLPMTGADAPAATSRNGWWSASRLRSVTKKVAVVRARRGPPGPRRERSGYRRGDQRLLRAAGRVLGWDQVRRKTMNRGERNGDTGRHGTCGMRMSAVAHVHRVPPLTGCVLRLCAVVARDRKLAVVSILTD